MYEVLTSTFGVMSYQAENKNINLQLEFDTSNAFVFQRLFGDRRRFGQVISNFVSNSLKFTNSEGFVKITLKVLEEQKGSPIRN
jgi:signal transduction histidine kinase